MPTEDELTDFYNQGYAYDRERYRETVVRQKEWLGLLGKFRHGSAKLLEIGCSYGYFLAAARECGWDVQGIELSEEAARFAREELGLRVVAGRVCECAENFLLPFDAVVAWHVLEHDLEPQRFLREAFDLLRPGGILALRVPNTESAAAKLAGRSWQWLSPPEHVFMYSRHILEMLLYNSGFEVLHSRTARGNAHNLWFEILRARTKALLSYPGRGANGTPERCGFAPPAKYENRLWYRAIEETISLTTKPVDWLISPWLARHGLEAELAVVARKPAVTKNSHVIFSSQEQEENLAARAKVTAPAFNPHAAARGALVKITPRKRRLIRAVELILLPFVRATDWLQPPEPSREQGPIRKILVVEYWQMGDAVLLLPLLRNLRAHYPQAQIAWMVNPRVMPLLAEQDLVDEFVPVRVPWAEHFSRRRKYNPISPLWLSLARTLLLLRRQRLDLALTARMDIRDNFLVWLTGARRRIGYGVGGGGFLLTDIAAPDLQHPHRTYSWLRLLECLEKPILEIHPRLKLSQAQQDFAEAFLASEGIRRDELILGVHPGARIPTRQWGKQNFHAVAQQLVSQLPAKVLWFEEPHESRSRQCTGSDFVRVSLPLEQFLAVLARCHLLICNDSGPMHMAEALGVPVVAIFGPQQPAWFGPTAEQSCALYRPEFWCRPCSDYCIFEQPYCLRTIPVEQVVEAASQAIQMLMASELRCKKRPEGIGMSIT